jgi:hypothetical protein
VSTGAGLQLAQQYRALQCGDQQRHYGIRIDPGTDLSLFDPARDDSAEKRVPLINRLPGALAQRGMRVVNLDYRVEYRAPTLDGKSFGYLTKDLNNHGQPVDSIRLALDRRSRLLPNQVDGVVECLQRQIAFACKVIVETIGKTRAVSRLTERPFSVPGQPFAPSRFDSRGRAQLEL